MMQGYVPHMEDSKITEQEMENDADLYKRPDRQNVDHKVQEILIKNAVEAVTDKYTKNLIMYNDVINNVKSERKRNAKGNSAGIKRP